MVDERGASNQLVRVACHVGVYSPHCLLCGLSKHRCVVSTIML